MYEKERQAGVACGMRNCEYWSIAFDQYCGAEMWDGGAAVETCDDYEPDLVVEGCRISNKEIRQIIQAYYEEPGNGAGGCCHVVLDDGNLEDSSVHFCQEECKNHDDKLGLIIMDILMKFTVKGREKINENWWGMQE